MAIQAQYPSNLLHVQEGKSSFGIDDQTNTVTAATNYSRKRRRETDETTTKTPALNTPFRSTQQPQPIDIGNMFTSQKNGVFTGLGLAFYDQQQQQQHSFSPQCSTNSSVQHFLDELGPYMKQHRYEFDHFLLAQGEQLRRALTEKRQRYYRKLLNAAEEILSKRLTEKEAEVGKAVRLYAELEAKANHLSLEAQAWQARAMMQENYAATLQSQLQQAMIAGGFGRRQGEYGGEGSSAGMVGVGEAEDTESAYIDPDRVVVSDGPICKSCRKRLASMVILPCRHLCLCTECDAVAQACPTCLMVRSSSIEVIFS